MIVAYILTNNNAWNGKWSGDDKLHCIVKTYTARFFDKVVRPAVTKFDGPWCKPFVGNIGDRRDFYYNFGDGWGANVEVRIVDASEARKLRKKSAGFAGYEWMVDSILDFGKIGNSLDQAKWREAEKATVAT